MGLPQREIQRVLDESVRAHVGAAVVTGWQVIFSYSSPELMEEDSTAYAWFGPEGQAAHVSMGYAEYLRRALVSEWDCEP